MSQVKLQAADSAGLAKANQVEVDMSLVARSPEPRRRERGVQYVSAISEVFIAQDDLIAKTNQPEEPTQ